MSHFAANDYDYTRLVHTSASQWGGYTGIGLGGGTGLGLSGLRTLQQGEAELLSTPPNAKDDLLSLFGSYASMRQQNTVDGAALPSSRASSQQRDSQAMSLDDLLNLGELLTSETDSNSGGMDAGVQDASFGITDSATYSYLTQLLASASAEDQPMTISPDEIWRDTTPTYVPPGSFDFPSIPIDSFATGAQQPATPITPSDQQGQTAGDPTPSLPPMTGDSAPGPPAEDMSSSPSVGIEIKTEPDLDESGTDGRPTRAIPVRAAKSRRRIPLDAPIQPRSYNGPSRTALKPLPKGFEKSLPPDQVAGVKRALEAEDDDDDDEGDVKDVKDKVAQKRKKNTLAARKSRARKQEYQETLEQGIAEKEARIAELERQLREKNTEIRVLKGLVYPDGREGV